MPAGSHHQPVALLDECYIHSYGLDRHCHRHTLPNRYIAADTDSIIDTDTIVDADKHPNSHQ